MKTIHQRHQILASLDAMDQSQTERVLDFIKGMLSQSPAETRHQSVKREALRQIRKALQENQVTA